MMKSQGIKGPPYNFLHGNTKEISNMRKESLAKPMDSLSHNMLPRILPHVYQWVHIYGKMNERELIIIETELVTG